MDGKAAGQGELRGGSARPGRGLQGRGRAAVFGRRRARPCRGFHGLGRRNHARTSAALPERPPQPRGGRLADDAQLCSRSRRRFSESCPADLSARDREGLKEQCCDLTGSRRGMRGSLLAACSRHHGAPAVSREVTRGKHLADLWLSIPVSRLPGCRDSQG